MFDIDVAGMVAKEGRGNDTYKYNILGQTIINDQKIT